MEGTSFQVYRISQVLVRLICSLILDIDTTGYIHVLQLGYNTTGLHA